MNHVTKKYCYVLGLTCLVIIDQITKLFFSSRDFFIGPLYLHPVNNYGLSFSLNFGVALNFVLIALGLIFLGYYYYSHRNEFSKKYNLAFLLIFSGAVSNILDRLYFGYVRDFIDSGLNFSFNLADVFIVAGLIVLLLMPSGDKAAN